MVLDRVIRFRPLENNLGPGLATLPALQSNPAHVSQALDVPRVDQLAKAASCFGMGAYSMQWRCLRLDRWRTRSRTAGVL
jgi:hypothetical protein